MTSWPSAGASGVSKLLEALEIVPGLTAVVGSGGKTSLIAALARKLPGTVIVATSTHIFPAAGLPLVTERVAKLPAPKICMGTPTGEGKLTAPMQPWAELIALADYVLLEADGSKRLPLKAHLPHEPVIPAEANQVIAVLGLSGLGQPIQEAAHRPEIYARLAGCTVEDVVTPARAAAVLQAEGGFTRLVLNQAEGREKAGRELAARLCCPVLLASLQEGWWRTCPRADTLPDFS